MNISLPREFTRAWLYALSGIVDRATTGRDGKSHLEKCLESLTIGMRKVMNSLSKGSLRSRAAMLPMELVPLIALRLLKDQVGQEEDDLIATYRRYLNSMVSECQE
jgi:hypothetical protein